MQAVPARAAAQSRIERIPPDLVVAGPAEGLIRADAALQAVVPAKTEEIVGAGLSCKNVRGLAADQAVVAGVADNRDRVGRSDEVLNVFDAEDR